MQTTNQIAKHLREVYFGNNWTASTLNDALKDVTWQLATKQIYDFNTIAILMFHMNYYINAVIKVLNGGPLDSNDKFSFDAPEINSQEDWQKLKESTFNEAEQLAKLLEKSTDAMLWQFIDNQEKYGIYYRNLQGIVEHCHYHLGQIVLIKKILKTETN